MLALRVVRVIRTVPTEATAGEPDTVRVCLNEVRYLADTLCLIVAGMAGFLVSDEESEGHT